MVAEANLMYTRCTQGLRKAEGSTEKVSHLMKIKEQTIQTLQQEIAVRLT